MSTIVDAGSAKLAGLQIDTLSKYRTGQLSLDHWERFVNLAPAEREARFGDWKKPEPTAPTEPTPSILEFVSTVMVNASTGKFVAKDKFKLKKDGGICSDIGANFKAWFLKGAGKIEDPISEQTLRYHKLQQLSVDGPIITELGGEVKAETTLSEMFPLMEKQKHGEDGVLLNSGWANIFYIKDIAGVLRAVSVYWSGDGWYVCAHPVENPRRWCDGDQVFSRNSVLGSSDPS